MKNINLIIIILLLISCKEEVKNPYFTSDEVYNKVLESKDIIQREISKTDKVFYVFIRYDTLIVMSAESPSILYPTLTIKLRGSFDTKEGKVIVTHPYKPVYNLIKENNALTNEIQQVPPYYSGNDYQKGVMYKIKDLNHLELIAKGDLRKYFYSIKEYELAPPPPPKEYLGKPYKRDHD
ncbi:hypothetical protein JSO59_002395 [Riemerella anatipestifer]|uniref:hypothetical protein n=1 Tax=Riemerella anatipestifer TaxID=34085 RepID=UPI0030BBBD16